MASNIQNSALTDWPAAVRGVALSRVSEATEAAAVFKRVVVYKRPHGVRVRV